MPTLPILKAGDRVEIIAPASRCTDQQLMTLKALLLSWQLDCRVNEDIFGDDLLCANTDEMRLRSLKKALQHPETKAIICARGGYGSMRLIPALAGIIPPVLPKLFVGMSDITALNLFLQQQWQWPVLHGALTQDTFSPESIAALKDILFGNVARVSFQGTPMNAHAEKIQTLETTLTGGNLCLVQTSLGTIWQINSYKKIILLEEVGERGYRVDRMLEQLRQANVFKDAAAIILGDFTEGNEPDGSSLIQPVLERFAKHCNVPVIKMTGIGHGYVNFPVPLGTKATLQLGSQIKLEVTTNFI